MSYTLKEIKEIRLLATGAKLERAELTYAYHNAQLQGICNGIGPECFPEWLRKTLNALHPTLVPVAFIHDLEWHRGDGQVKSFLVSNLRFRRNGWRMAKFRYAWFDPRRYLVMRQASRFARLCTLFGWGAWTRASGINKEEKTK